MSREKEFIEAVIALEKAWSLSIAHEDPHGAFIIEPFSESNAKWLRAAVREEDEG